LEVHLAQINKFKRELRTDGKTEKSEEEVITEETCLSNKPEKEVKIA
jgi:hypothetical protein